MRRYDPTLPVLGLPGSAWLRLAAEAGLTTVAEAFADRAYAADGRLVPRTEDGAVLEDADAVADRSVRLACAGEVEAVDGTVVAVQAGSVCVHGDSPAAVAMAQAVRAALTGAGVRLASVRRRGASRAEAQGARAGDGAEGAPVRRRRACSSRSTRSTRSARSTRRSPRRRRPGWSTSCRPPAPCWSTFDPARDRRRTVGAWSGVLPGRASGATAPRRRRGAVVEVPVRYDGPDLDEVGRLTGLGAARRRGRAHRPGVDGGVLRVRAGFGYLVGRVGGADGAAPGQPAHPGAGRGGRAGRRVHRRLPARVPGGWQLLGVTDVPVWDPTRAEPALLRPGVRVRFVERR